MPDNQELTIGATAPDFSLPSSSGGEVTLSSYRDKTSVYLFFVREFN